jgi:hypothetical protein
MRVQWQIGVVVGALLGASLDATAATIISNLPGNDGTSTFINAAAGGSDGGSVEDSKAAGFTMPAGTDYELDAVLLRLNFFNLASDPLVELYSDLAGSPDTLLMTFVNPALAVGLGTFTFVPSVPFILDPATTYWIVVSNAAVVANSFQWMANLPSIVPTGLATTAGYLFSTGPPPPTESSTFFNSYEVQGTAVAVPAPGASVLVSAGLIVALRWRAAAISRNRRADTPRR